MLAWLRDSRMEMEYWLIWRALAFVGQVIALYAAPVRIGLPTRSFDQTL